MCESNAPWIECALGCRNPNGICMRAESNAYALDSTFLDCVQRSSWRGLGVKQGVGTNEIEGRLPKGLRDHLIQSQAKSASRKAATNDPGRDSTALDKEPASITPAASALERQPTITGAKASRRKERERRAWSGPSTSQSASVTGQGRPELSVSKPWRGAAQGTGAEGRAREPETACRRRGGDGARRRQRSTTDRARWKDAKWSKEEEVAGGRYVGGRGDARARARKGERGTRFERAGGAAGGPGFPDRGEAVPDADSQGRALYNIKDIVIFSRN